MASLWWDNNSHRVTLSGLQDSAGAYVNAATVTVTVTDLAGNETTGATWPLAMTYETASDGVYYADVPPLTDIVVNQYVYVTVNAEQDGLYAEWSIKAPVRRRD